MRKYIDILNESLADPLPINWEQRSMDRWYGTFMAGDEEYFIMCYHIDGFDHPDHPGDQRRTGKWYDMAFGLTRDTFLGTKVIGTDGMQFRIFATVIAGISEFIHDVHPEMIMVSASKENDNRLGLYQRMARRFSSQLTALGYEPVEAPEHQYADIRAIADTIAWRRRDKRVNEGVIEEGDEIVPQIDQKKLAKAAGDGFDTARIWYHGTRSKGNFTRFKIPTKERNGFELGRGVYVTQFVGTANVWAQGQGAVLACVIRTGKLVELSEIPTSALWHPGDPGNALWQEAYRGYQMDLDSQRATLEADTEYLAFLDKHGMRRPTFEDTGYRDFAEKMNRGKLSIGACLSRVGYIGATDRHSQIRGQAVIWNPEDVRIVGKAPGFDGFVAD